MFKTKLDGSFFAYFFSQFFGFFNQYRYLWNRCSFQGKKSAEFCSDIKSISKNDNKIISCKKEKQRHLEHYSSFSELTRTKVATLELMSEVYVSFAFTTIMGMVLAATLHILLLQTFLIVVVNPYSILSLGKYLMLVTDSLLFLVPIYYAGNLAFFAGKTFPVICYAWYLHLGEVTRQTVGRIERSQVFARRGSFLLCEHKLVSYWTSVFISEHSLLLLDLITLNRHIVSTLLFAFYFPNWTANVYVISLLTFSTSLSWTIRQSLYFLLFAQFNCFLILALLPQLGRAFYSNDRAIYKAVFLCDSWLRQKLKLATYYELLRTSRPFVFTLGSYARISNKFLFEV